MPQEWQLLYRLQDWTLGILKTVQHGFYLTGETALSRGYNNHRLRGSRLSGLSSASLNPETKKMNAGASGCDIALSVGIFANARYGFQRDLLHGSVEGLARRRGRVMELDQAGGGRGLRRAGGPWAGQAGGAL